MTDEERDYILNMYKEWLSETLSPDQIVAAVYGRWDEVTKESANILITKKNDVLFASLSNVTGLFEKVEDYKSAYELKTTVASAMSDLSIWKHENYTPKISAEAVRAKQSANGAKSKKSSNYKPLLEKYHDRYPACSFNEILKKMENAGECEFENGKVMFESDEFTLSTEPKSISAIRKIWGQVINTKKVITG